MNNGFHSQLVSFLNFHQTFRRRGWMLTLPVFTGQEENNSEIALLYRKMAEWGEKQRTK